MFVPVNQISNADEPLGDWVTHLTQDPSKVATPWGALAPGTLVATSSSSLSFQGLGVTSAYFSLPVFLNKDT